MLCLAFGPDDITYSGTLSGDVYMWRGNNLIKVVQEAHEVREKSIIVMISSNEQTPFNENTLEHDDFYFEVLCETW